MSRLAVYVFWEKEGIVRDYVVTYLKGLTTVASKIYVVVNGEIQPQGKERIEQETGAVVLQRPNEGVDFWAYKTALDHEGEGISAYDEVVLCNCSCYGPIYPFSEMFDEMGTRRVDFWGITEWPLNEGGYRGTWVLSYFMVFRPHLFLSHEWKEYWKNLSPVYSREECIDKHETKFTAYFAERGFSYDVYCPNTLDYIDPTIEAPDKLVIEQRCPIIKRKAFCTDYCRFLPYRNGDASCIAIEYLKTKNLYDVDEILDDLIATQHGAFLQNCLQLHYVLPDNFHTANLESRGAICFQMSFETQLDENFSLLLHVPQNMDIYIVTTAALLELVQEKVEKYGIQPVAVVEGENIAGALGALFKLKKELMAYDCVCAIHDGSESTCLMSCAAVASWQFTTKAALASAAYVNNVVTLFEQTPRLGLLSPMKSLCGSYCGRYGQEWGLNYKNTESLLQHYGIDVPISEEVPPVAPLEGIFWFCPKALEKLLSLEFSEDCFEKGNPDGTLYHAILRALPYFAQSAGYLSGEMISTAASTNQITNLSYLYRQDNLLLCSGGKATYIPVEINIGVRRAVKNYLKRHLPTNLVKSLCRVYHWFCRR